MHAPDVLETYRRWREEQETALQRLLFAQQQQTARAIAGKWQRAYETARFVKLEEQREVARRAYRNFAVFSRNHELYLAKAYEIGLRDPSRQVTFRSRIPWVSAAEALTHHGPVPIYFAEIGNGPFVTYEALLEYTAIDPGEDPEEAAELLQHQLPGRRGRGTEEEGLWDEDPHPVRTLYVISGCRMITRVRLRDLARWNERRHLSDSYARAYALVRRLVSR